jgi:serralysin
MPITGTSGPDVLIGGPGDDLLQGFEGDDLLDGREGMDTMDGGPGNDVYLVDQIPDPVLNQFPDIIIERLGEGENDMVLSSATQYELTRGAFVETLGTINKYSTMPMTLIGNEYANSIYGNAGDNSLHGAEGNDYLVGRNGNDLLSGGLGDDILQGGPGDDVYWLFDEGTDRVIELSGEGYDTIMTRRPINYFQLAPGVEVEVLKVDEFDWPWNGPGTTLIGNEFNNLIHGYHNADSLSDGGGVDTLIGGWSGDKYYVSDGRATIVEGVDIYGADGRQVMFNNAMTHLDDYYYQDAAFTSVDYILGSAVHVELLSTYWMYGFDPIDLTGNELDNRLIGNNAANILDAKGGWNILQGLGGDDVFKFSSVDFAAGDLSHIIDFEQGSDRIHLDSTLFGLPPGALSAEAFRLGTQAGDADDRIIYDPNAGILYFDPDGNGTLPQAAFARFDLPLEMQSVGDVFVPPNLQASDFSVI